MNQADIETRMELAPPGFLPRMLRFGASREELQRQAVGCAWQWDASQRELCTEAFPFGSMRVQARLWVPERGLARVRLFWELAGQPGGWSKRLAAQMQYLEQYGPFTLEGLDRFTTPDAVVEHLLRHGRQGSGARAKLAGKRGAEGRCHFEVALSGDRELRAELVLDEPRPMVTPPPSTSASLHLTLLSLLAQHQRLAKADRWWPALATLPLLSLCSYCCVRGVRAFAGWPLLIGVLLALVWAWAGPVASFSQREPAPAADAAFLKAAAERVAWIYPVRFRATFLLPKRFWIVLAMDSGQTRALRLRSDQVTFALRALSRIAPRALVGWSAENRRLFAERGA